MRDVAIVLVDGNQRTEVDYDSPIYAATMEWARFHGLDPMRIPAGSVLERDAARRRILFTEFVFDGDLLRVDDHDEAVTVDRVEQGEAPPLPFPAEVDQP